MNTIPSEVRQFIDGDLHAALAARGFEPDGSVEAGYVRYKPGVGAVVAFAMGDGPDQTSGYLRWCGSPSRAAELGAKAATRRWESTPFGPGVRLLSDRQTLLVLMPNDLKIRKLRWVTAPAKLKRLVEDEIPWGADISKSRSSIEVIRHKPERRIICRASLALRSGESQDVFVRLATTPVGSHLAAAAHALRIGGVEVPTPLAALEEDRLHIEQAVAGLDLVDLATSNSLPDPYLIEETINGIHRCTPPDLPEAPDVFETMLIASRSLGDYSPDLGMRTEQIIKRLTETHLGPNRTLIHGDMHLHQFVVGSKITVVDLERAAIGNPMADIGRWHAHTLSLAERLDESTAAAIRSFGESVTEHARHRPGFDHASFAVHATAGLIDQALRGARHLEPGWNERAHTLLDHAWGLMHRTVRVTASTL